MPRGAVNLYFRSERDGGASELLLQAATIAISVLGRELGTRFNMSTPDNADAALIAVRSDRLGPAMEDSSIDNLFIAEYDPETRLVRGRRKPHIVGFYTRAQGASMHYGQEMEEQDLVQVIENFLREVIADPPPSQIAWLKSSELLIKKIEVLVEDGARLRRLLQQAYDDRDVAEARAEELEHLLAAFILERSGTKRRINHQVLSTYALVFATFFAPLAAVAYANDGDDQSVADVVKASNQVIQDCGYIGGDVNFADQITLNVDNMVIMSSTQNADLSYESTHGKHAPKEKD